MDFNQHLQLLQARVNQALIQKLPLNQEPVVLHEAMRYSVLNGGKRIRPILVYATGEALAVPYEELDDAACAVELIHAYSLIHDDLPAMDDDDLRRGVPTCHKAFDEATAILAGDAIQSLAFQILASSEALAIKPKKLLSMLETLAKACGSFGMAGGQALDLIATGKPVDLAQLERIHRLKTGALIHASVMLGASAAESDEHLAKLDKFAKNIGLAFQIQDDILDNDTDVEKPSYSSIMGLDFAKQQVEQLHSEALHSIQSLDAKANNLRKLASFLIHRDH